MTKKAYELKANVNSAEMWVGDKPLRFEAGAAPYETSDGAEIVALDKWDAVKAVEKPVKAEKAKG